MYKYLITVKCSFQNVRVCNHSVWFATDSGGSAKMLFSRPGATWEVTESSGWGGQCKIDSDASSLQRCGVVWGNNSSLGCRSVVLWLKELGGVTGPLKSHLWLLFNQVSGGHPDQGGPCEETGGGWAWGRGQDREEMGQGEKHSLSLLFEMMFVLWHSAAPLLFLTTSWAAWHPDQPGGCS